MKATQSEALTKTEPVIIDGPADTVLPRYIRILAHVQGPRIPTCAPGQVAMDPDPAILAAMSPDAWESISPGDFKAGAWQGVRNPQIERKAG